MVYLRRPAPDKYPVVYNDDGSVLDDPNKLTKAQEKAVAESLEVSPAATPGAGN